MITKLRHWWNLRKAPHSELRQLNELVIKSARRCAYDLRHAASYIAMTEPVSGLPPECEIFHERARYWLSVFNPADGGKNYHSTLGNEISKLELEVERLEKLCRDNNIDPTHPDRFPF